MSTTPTFNLTWEEVRAVALDGAKVRRESWTQWVSYTTGIWRLLDRSLNPIEVITAGDFGSADYQANDWTTDPIGTTRDVCVIDPPNHNQFTPPSLSLSIGYDAGTLTAVLGASLPSGSYQLRFLVNGETVGLVEATTGATTISVSYAGLLTINATVVAVSRLPLPSWSGIATDRLVIPVPPSGTLLSTSTIAYTCLHAGYDRVGWPIWDFVGSIGPIEPVETITNSYAYPVLVTVTGDVNDDVAFDGTIYTPGQDLEPYWLAGTISGIHSFSAAFTLAPGASLAVGCRNNIGAEGYLNATVIISVP